jgi:hypothetical protein
MLCEKGACTDCDLTRNISRAIFHKAYQEVVKKVTKDIVVPFIKDTIDERHRH